MENLLKYVYVSNNYKIAYLQSGKGTPMIFLHNGGLDHRIWDFQIEKFSKNYEVFALDLLGYGQSDKPEVEYTLNLYVDILSDFIEKLGLANVILVGHCIGSATTLSYTIKNPDNVKAIILFNLVTKKILLDGYAGYSYKVLTNAPVRYFLKQLSEKFVPDKWMLKFVVPVLYGKKGEPDNEFIEHFYDLNTSPSQLRVLYSLLLNFESFKQLDQFTKPTNFPKSLLIWGVDNKILPVNSGKKFAEKLKPDVINLFEECGHLVMRENSKEVNECIENFINEFLSSSESL
ncbi:MAG: alpha/beta hydrolase [Desulfobacterales bacterium]|nr:alpha/beta hydrolase [Desulfobacterales bacterium]